MPISRFSILLGRRRPKTPSLLAALLLCGAALPGGGLACRKPAQAGPPPKVMVTVSRPMQREVVEWDDYTGHLDAPEFVNVSARVSGEIVDVPFNEGSIVKAGALLFVIDERPFQADVAAKKAAVDRDGAQLDVANITLRRIEQGGVGAGVSAQERDTAVANVKTAQATLDADKAAQRVSELNLEWCRVRAPITGRVSNKRVTVGNQIVGAATGATLLTTITSVDPIYLYVDVDEASVLRYQQLAAEKKRVSARDQRIPCFMQLGNEKGYPHEGVIDFVNNSVDPNTGTLRARGVFPNPSQTMLPGFYASMRIAGSGRYQALLVPDAAVGTQQNLRYVMTVGPDNKVTQKTVSLGAVFGALRSILSGIGPDDRVIINGQMLARPGATVDVVEKPIDAAAFELTAPGSPTTRELPSTRPFGPTTNGSPTMAPMVPATRPATQPVTQPAMQPVTQPTAAAAAAAAGAGVAR